MDEKKRRRDYRPIQIYCLPEERSMIAANAKDAGMSLSSFLRSVGQGYRVAGVVDGDKVIEMTKINGDLGRLGGLLKLWLTDDARMKPFGVDHINALLARIEALSVDMRKAMREVIRQKRPHSNLAAKSGSEALTND